MSSPEAAAVRSSRSPGSPVLRTRFLRPNAIQCHEDTVAATGSEWEWPLGSLDLSEHLAVRVEIRLQRFLIFPQDLAVRVAPFNGVK